MMTDERMQAIADHVLEQIAVQYGSTRTRDFRVIELVLRAVNNNPDKAIEHVKDPATMTAQERIQFPPFTHGRVVCRNCESVVAQCRCARHTEIAGYVDRCQQCPPNG